MRLTHCKSSQIQHIEQMMQKGENDEQGLCGSCGMYGRFIYRGCIFFRIKSKSIYF
nr:MAG TPA_asm: DnaK suppressor protein [Caudoviricetes sp.]